MRTGALNNVYIKFLLCSASLLWRTLPTVHSEQATFLSSQRFILFSSYLYHKDERARPENLQNIKRLLPPSPPKNKKPNASHYICFRPISFFVSLCLSVCLSVYLSVRVLKWRATAVTVSRRPSLPPQDRVLSPKSRICCEQRHLGRFSYAYFDFVPYQYHCSNVSCSSLS